MYKNVLQAIDGIQLYPLISLIIFFSFFAVLLYWVFSLDKKTIHEMESMPLDNDEPINLNQDPVIELNGGKSHG